ncbi:MAG TPA: hypothetical protein VN682_26005 [Terriglobales bacterium]|nr:hypothetical protein [Terriglobales bacterium]
MKLSSTVKFSSRTVAAILAFSCCATAQPGNGNLLTPNELQKLLPSAVYYRGQTAPIQLRNSGGVRFSDGHYVLATLVDTSGYSSNLAAKYQGYLITEVPLVIAGKRIGAGAYGIGFVSGDKFVVTDLGANDVLTVHAEVDPQMARPRPLQILTSPSSGFRLYAGRSYVQFGR